MILSSQEKERMKNYVINSLIEKYNYPKDKASDIVNNSSFIEELQKIQIKFYILIQNFGQVDYQLEVK